MLDLTNTPPSLLDPISKVVAAAIDAAEELAADQVMIVGACCRDILHSALGHIFDTAATRDLDLALALSSWDAYRALTAAFSKVGDTGIRFRIADIDVDLIPFGEVEDPAGVVEPPSRGESLSVWAFDEIYASALPITLTDTLTIRVPNVAGYAAAKLAAWLDRSEWHEAKDAPDLALVLYWYSESVHIHDLLYETPIGQDILLAENSDLALAAAHMLGTDVTSTIGAQRRTELLARWPGNAHLLERELQLRGGPIWPYDPQRRLELIAALTRGLSG
jgi:predicted nucleotidyltransferase